MLKYEDFLKEAHSELVAMVGELEDLEFHHAQDGSPQWIHYSRVVTVLGHLQERIGWWNDHTKSKTIQT